MSLLLLPPAPPGTGGDDGTPSYPHLERTGRCDRRALTATLNLYWRRLAPALRCNTLCGFWSPPAVRFRRRGRLFEKQRSMWQRQRTKRRHGLLGVRVGRLTTLDHRNRVKRRSQALAPLHNLLRTALQSDVVSPVKLDPSNAFVRSQGASLVTHCGHCSGTLEGAVPIECLAAHNLDACAVCGNLVDSRFNGTHPRCRPTGRASAGRASPGDADAALPAFEEIMAAAVPTLRHVPVVARAAWAQCLARTVSAAATLNTTASCRSL